MNFARRLFLVAGIYGVLVLLPMYFLERRLAEVSPPAVTHPELYYGFVGAALAWQIVYLLVSRDPSRYRPLMLVGAGCKTSYGLAVVILYALGRADASVLGASSPDLLFAALFVAAWWRTEEWRPGAAESRPPLSAADP